MSDSTPAAGSRIIAAEALTQIGSYTLAELQTEGASPRHRLGRSDLTNETARAAYALGRSRGYAQGAQAGLQQGFSEGSQALQEFESRKAADVQRQMQTLVESFRGEMAALETQVASDLISLAIDIARQVLRRELSLDAKALLPVANEALKALGEGASQLEILVHPVDAALLRPRLEADPGARHWKLGEDDSLSRGGCRVNADTGVADASFEARWQAVMATLGRDEEPLP